MKGDGAEGKPSKGGPPSDGGKPSKGSPMDGTGSASKPMGDPKKDPMTDKTAQKPAETRNKEDNKGDQKGAASKSPPSDQQASSKGQGSPSDGSPSGSPKPGSSGSPPSGNPPPPGPKAPGAESVRKAVPDEENAAGNLDENKRPKASEDLTEADKKLREAREELEKRLKQLREQELERILANLEQRVNKMLQMQIAVKAATEGINAQILKHPEKKALPVDFQNSQKQEDVEAEIIGEADKAIQLVGERRLGSGVPGRVRRSSQGYVAGEGTAARRQRRRGHAVDRAGHHRCPDAHARRPEEGAAGTRQDRPRRRRACRRPISRNCRNCSTKSPN